MRGDGEEDRARDNLASVAGGRRRTRPRPLPPSQVRQCGTMQVLSIPPSREPGEEGGLMEFEPAQDRYEYSLRVRLPICAKTFADGHGSLDTDRRSSPEIQMNSEQKNVSPRHSSTRKRHLALQPARLTRFHECPGRSPNSTKRAPRSTLPLLP